MYGARVSAALGSQNGHREMYNVRTCSDSGQRPRIPIRAHFENVVEESTFPSALSPFPFFPSSTKVIKQEKYLELVIRFIICFTSKGDSYCVNVFGTCLFIPFYLYLFISFFCYMV